MSLYHKSSQPLFIPTEILQKISSHFKDDTSTLFSCILVSRNWCTSLIEVLWSQPFHLSHSPRLVETYLSFLPENSRDQLKLKNFPSFEKGYKFLFDYPSFLKKLSIPLICNAIGEYLREESNIKTLTFTKMNYYTVNYLEQLMYTDLIKLFSKQKHIHVSYNFKSFFKREMIILRELCRLIYNKVNVINELEFHTGLNFSEDLTLQLDVEELTQLQDHFKGLKVLAYSGNNEALCFLAKHCKRIETIKLFQITCGKYASDNDDLSIQLISSQKNLRNLEIHDWKIPPSSTTITTLLQSIQTQANSLRSIKLINCDFKKSKSLLVLSNCRNLEEIIIKENYNLDEKLLVPLTKIKFSNLKTFIYKFQLINFINNDDDDLDDDDEFIEDEFFDTDEIFSYIISNAKDTLRIVSINGFKTLQSLRNTLNSLTECKNLIKLDIMLEKSENTLSLLLSIIKNNQSLEKLYIVSDTHNLDDNNNLFIDANQFLHLFINVLPQNFKILRMHTPDWCFNTNTLNQFLEKAKFRIKSMYWMNHECDLDCSEVLRKYAKLNGYKLLFREDCRFVNNNIIMMNVFFE
ncbi:hypothetical protein RclHR1_03170003 [Rhizophagus clarus]|uniref:Uncharacterized protein n=1 Tax=Rhizophagus clarus TaxID=94130 RepID=A0A2Z6R738_9GLOM|nr:hypothetical protein RclHR1_03170003 [Rhizophagus clarus]GET00483.1 hypothetical protein GLOIN_2v1768220 [Rhizophagus clarus]